MANEEVTAMECPKCGELLRMMGTGYSQMSQPHHCPGAPSASTVRRLIREEIEAAEKRRSGSGEVL